MPMALEVCPDILVFAKGFDFSHLKKRARCGFWLSPGWDCLPQVRVCCSLGLLARDLTDAQPPGSQGGTKLPILEMKSG